MNIEQICKGEKSKGYKKFLKRIMKRKRRREERRLLEEAGRRNGYRGWSL